MTPRKRFLNACRCEPVDRPPVWLMRQAGRYLPEYHEVRRDHSFLSICRTPDVAVEVSLQPVRRFPLDVSIIFSDILVIPEAMGQQLSFGDGGPRLEPVAGVAEGTLAIDKIRPVEPDRLSYVGDAIAQLRRSLTAMGSELAVMGFAGAPLTLSAYMCAGGPPRDLNAMKRLMWDHPDKAHALLQNVAATLTGYLKMQIKKGADAVQIFESCGDQVSPEDYRTFGIPPLQAVLESLRSTGVPVIYYLQGTAAHLHNIASLPFDVLSADYRVDLASVQKALGEGRALQGNIDPQLLYAPAETIRNGVASVRRSVKGHGLILNLGGGVRPDTPVPGVQAFVEAVCALENS